MALQGLCRHPDLLPVYEGADLGLSRSDDSWQIRIWSPEAERAQVLLFREGAGGSPFEVCSMQPGEQGTWLATLPAQYEGLFYTIRVFMLDTWSLDVPDPYSRLVGVNGMRSLLADLKDTDPDGWAFDTPPSFSEDNRPEDAIIYEVHIRDLGMDPSSGMRHPGKFLSLTEENTRNANDLSTGLAHMKELGVTHIHILPVNDFMSVDEAAPFPGAYNWGYDPLHFFTPEGSYSSDPFHGKTRIKELKSAIQHLHKNGLRVVFDVVFNHTGLIRKSNFHQLVPGYYYRHLPNGDFSDASGCGNETASERPMFRKLMLDCLTYWVREFHADGFRFDLMGIHDLETMQYLSKELKTIRPDILLYGEGWAGGESPLAHDQRAVKDNAPKLNGIAVFSDDIRDALKGKLFDTHQKGFIGGAKHLEQTIRAGIVAACAHPQVDYSNSSQPGHAFAQAPGQVISYCECHDNHTLWDRLALTNPAHTEEERKKMQLLALSIILTSQGIPFLHAGTEFLRSKNGMENSYKSPDIINSIKWNQKTQHQDLVNEIITLIHIRRMHSAFRLRTGDQIASLIHFDEQAPEGTVAYSIQGEKVQDRWKKVWVGMNQHPEKKKLHLPEGEWHLAFPSHKAGKKVQHQLYIPGISLLIAYQL